MDLEIATPRLILPNLRPDNTETDQDNVSLASMYRYVTFVYFILNKFTKDISDYTGIQYVLVTTC